MAFDTPGVYINYRMDGPLVIRAASTSTAVFIGPTVIGRSVTGTGADTVVTPTFVSSLTEYSNVFATTGARSGVVSLPSPGDAQVDTMGHAVRGFFMNGGRNAYIVSTSTGTEATATGPMRVQSAGDTTSDYSISALSAGAWGNDVRVRMIASPIGAGYLDLEITQTLTRAIAEGDEAGDPDDDEEENGDGGANSDHVVIVERFSGVRAAELADVSSNIVKIAVHAGHEAAPALILDVSAAPPANLPEVSANLEEGASSWSATTDDFGRIFDALRDIDDISLIVLPEAVWPDDDGPYSLALAHCQAMKDRMTLIQLADTARDFAAVTIPNDKFAAVYFPRINVTLPMGGGARLTTPVNTTGHIAGIYARTDSQRGAWTAPAGTHAAIAGMTAFTVEVGHAFQARMNIRNINALRYIGGVPVVWGARSRDTGIYLYVPVMRTAMLIADSLRTTLENYVFAMNTKILWGNVKAGVTGFMEGLYSQGAFQGATPGQAFRVSVGVPDSMSQADVAAGVLKVNVAFRPALAAEFIEINIEQIFEPAG
jgi:uncharacterized protein